MKRLTLDDAKVRANERALATGEPFAVVSYPSGLRVMPVVKVPDARPLVYMTVTPAEWNRTAGFE